MFEQHSSPARRKGCKSIFVTQNHAIVFTHFRENSTSTQCLQFSHPDIIAFASPQGYRPGAFSSDCLLGVKLNAKFAAIYVVVFWIGLVRWLCYTHSWPDG
jgi:hypothetical protein